MRLGRHKATICKAASELGLTDTRRKKVDIKATQPKYKSAEERNVANSERAKAYWKTHKHPRGALGLVHSQETRNKMSAASRRWWKGLSKQDRLKFAERGLKTKIEKYGRAGNFTSGGNAYSRCKRGKRPDLDNIFFRSAWEANFARYLNFLKERGQIKDWKYEPKTFLFEGVTRGVISYLPDFLVIENNESETYYEVKGWMTSRSKSALKRMSKFYPEIKIIIVDKSAYKEIENKIWRLIPNWEK